MNILELNSFVSESPFIFDPSLDDLEKQINDLLEKYHTLRQSEIEREKAHWMKVTEQCIEKHPELLNSNSGIDELAEPGIDLQEFRKFFIYNFILTLPCNIKRRAEKGCVCEVEG